MKRLNWKFLLILVVVIAMLGVGALGAYKFQKRRSVAALLVQAKAAEKAGDHANADGLYAHYLGFRRDDSATMADYGLMLAGDADTPAARVKALGVLDQALRLDDSRSDIRRELIRIEMDRTVRLYAEAFQNLEACCSPRPTMAGWNSRRPSAGRESGSTPRPPNSTPRRWTMPRIRSRPTSVSPIS